VEAAWVFGMLANKKGNTRRVPLQNERHRTLASELKRHWSENTWLHQGRQPKDGTPGYDQSRKRSPQNKADRLLQ